MKRCLNCFELINEDLEICPHCGYFDGSYSENNVYLVPGTMLSGRYSVGKVLSSDKESITYAAWDNDSNVKVNVREYFPDGYVTRSSSSVIPINNDCKEHFEAGFSNYVEVAKQLFGGNGSVKLYDCIAENNTAYMILENSDLAASPNAYAQSASGNKSLAGKSKGLPLWAKIVIPTTTVVVIAGVVVGIAFACGVFKQSEDSFVVSRGSEDSQNTDDSDDIPHEDGWYKDGNDSYYYQDGKKIKGWLNITEHKYYFDPDTGIMAIGWQDIDGEKYYFEDSGEMVNGWQSIDGLLYCFDEDSGVMQTGWAERHNGDQTDIYYLNPDDGSSRKGWLEIDGSKYYLNPEDFKMVKDWKQIDGSWYYFDSKGVMQKGWLELGENWYYLDDAGKMATGVISIDGSRYYFDSNGMWIEEPVEVVETHNDTTGYHGNTVYYSYPQISIIGLDMSVVNDQIYEDTLWYAQKGYEGMSYVYYIDDDIISICLEAATDMSYTTYSVYNISVETGEFISSSEFIERQGLTDDEFFDMVEDAYDKYWEEINEYVTGRYASVYEERHQRNYERISYDYVAPFLSPDGDLCFVSYDMMIIGGADCDCVVINTAYPTEWFGRLYGIY